jgi:basic amino acid/polyamine antiporter, APA family
VTNERVGAQRSGSGGGLRREVGLGMFAVYGAGTILGAGIYVLIGEIAGVAGFWTPLAFAVAAAVALVNGMTYAELATRFPRAGGPTNYVSNAFGVRPLSIGIGWAIVATGVVSAATITSGFAGYLSTFVELPAPIVHTVLLTVLAAVAVIGAKQSAWFMAVTTGLGVLGLLVVLAIGFFGTDAEPGRLVTEAPSLGGLAVLGGVASAAFLAIYAFIGFEDMVQLAEEVKRPTRTIPRAIAIAVGSAAVFYVLVAVASLAILDPEELADASAPLVAAVEAGGLPGWPVAILSLWIIMNGALAQIVMASRVIYDLGGRGGSPDWLAEVWGRTNTPARATLAATLVALAMSLLFPLQQLASITSFIMLVIFATSNLALITLERREPDAPFDTPVFLPYVGLVLSVSLMVATFFVPQSGG